MGFQTDEGGTHDDDSDTQRASKRSDVERDEGVRNTSSGVSAGSDGVGNDEAGVSDEGTDTDLSRRSYVSLLAAAGVTIGAGALASGNPGDTVVDLGEEGLSEGDRIGPYFEEYFEDGVEVHVPAGSYEWHGSGWGQVSNASLIGDGEVELHRPDEMNPRLEAMGGLVVVKNVTIRGQAGDNSSSVRLGAHDSDAVLLVENFNQPDGAVEPSRATGIYVPPAHAGALVLRDCHVEGFADNGLYASSPGGHPNYTAYDGAVIVDGGLYKNNNIANVRIGSSNSVVQNATMVHDGHAPVASNGADIRRGLRIRQPGQNLRVINCDIVQREQRWAVSIHSGASGGSGIIEDTRIHTDTSDPAIRHQSGYSGDWWGRNVHITGDGNLDSMIPLEDSCQGDHCDAPSDEPREPVDGSELVFAGSSTRSYEYTFTASGRISPRYEEGDQAANVEDLDVVTQNDDGTWTAEGSVPLGTQYGDTFVFDGSIESVDVVGDHDDVTVELDGTEVPIEELVGGGTDPGDGEDDGSDGEDGNDADDGSDGDDGVPDDASELVVVTDDSGGIEYEFVTSGEITPLRDREEYNANTVEPADEAWENDDGTWTGHGYTSGAGHSGDSYTFEGDVLSFDIDGDADGTTLYLDGTVVTVDELVVEEDGDDEESDGEDGSDGNDGEDGDDGSDGDDEEDDSDEGETLPNVVLIDSSASATVTPYVFAVSGDVERAESLSSAPDDTPHDRMEDSVEDGEVVGVVERGVDAFRYSGTIESIHVRGNAAVTFESDE